MRKCRRRRKESMRWRLKSTTFVASSCPSVRQQRGMKPQNKNHLLLTASWWKAMVKLANCMNRILIRRPRLPEKFDASGRARVRQTRKLPHHRRSHSLSLSSLCLTHHPPRYNGIGSQLSFARSHQASCPTDPRNDRERGIVGAALTLHARPLLEVGVAGRLHQLVPSHRQCPRLMHDLRIRKRCHQQRKKGAHGSAYRFVSEDK